MERNEYKVAVVQYKGQTKAIVCHGSDKCSALVALTNFMYLRAREINPNHVSRTVDQQYLSQQVLGSIEKYFGLNKNSSMPKESILNAAKCLHLCAPLTPVNSRCNLFKASHELSIFRILGVPLLHGWVLDPEDKEFNSLMGLSYDNVVELSALTNQTPSGVNVEEVGEDDNPAKRFLNVSKLQLTNYGLHQLNEKMQEGGLAILYAKNEYSVLHKHDDDLFILEASEDNVKQRPAAMWRKLAIEEEESFYVTGRYSPTKGQQKKKADLANAWFMAKISAFDDKKPTEKKPKVKRNLTKQLEDKSIGCTSESVLPIADVGKVEECQKSDVAGLAHELSSQACPSSEPVPPPTQFTENFFQFLTEFRDQSTGGSVPHFESTFKEMIRTGSFKLYVPFSVIQKYNGNLAIDIQDEFPRIRRELVQSVVNCLTKYGADKNDAEARADLEIQNLPPRKWNQRFLEFAKENEMVATYLLYNCEKDNTPTPVGRRTGDGYVNHIFDQFEEGKGWSEGWKPEEMEVRNNATEFVITKEPDVDLTKEVAVANLLTFVGNIYDHFEGTVVKRHPAFFDTFVDDILKCPTPKKDCPVWRRYVRFMRSSLAWKAPLVRSTLLSEMHRVLSLQLMLKPAELIVLTRTGVILDWRGLVRTEMPFSKVYNFRNNISRNYYYDKWEISHWHVLQFSRHCIEHLLDYLKKMILLHDIGIVELMVARRLERYIADTVRTIVMEYGVEQLFSSVWGHFEASDSTTMPKQILLQDNSFSSLTSGQETETIDKLIVRVSHTKSGGRKSSLTYSVITVPSSNQNLHLLDIKQFLESKNIHVEELGDNIINDDCVEINMVVEAGEQKIAIHSRFCEEYHTIMRYLDSFVSSEGVDPE